MMIGRSITIALLSLGWIACEASAQADYPKHDSSLQKGAFFARPVTQLEITIVNLKRTISDLAKLFKDDSVDLIDPRGDVAFDADSGRIILGLSHFVNGMKDPWKEVCDGKIRALYGLLGFPNKEMDPEFQLSKMERYFGESVRLDRVNARAAIKPFLDSIVTKVIFQAPTDDKKGLRWVRSCALDNMTARTIYKEHN